jgi:hypothetical protein
MSNESDQGSASTPLSQSRHAALGLLTRDEAAAYLGVEARQLVPLAEQYGIGRRYVIEPEPNWYYTKADLDEIKAGLKA